MATLSIQDVARHCGLSEPALRYYEEIGLIGPIARDERSRHRRYGDGDVDRIEVLTCLRAVGMGIEEMRTYLDNGACVVIDRADEQPAFAHDRERELRLWNVTTELLDQAAAPSV
jgi:DNA-binding transcriptional MerR regulator